MARTVVGDADDLIAGPPPLGPGAPASERLRAFGDGYIELLERHSELVVAAGPTARDGRGPYTLYATHLALLLTRPLMWEDAR